MAHQQQGVQGVRRKYQRPAGAGKAGRAVAELLRRKQRECRQCKHYEHSLDAGLPWCFLHKEPTEDDSTCPKFDKATFIPDHDEEVF